VHFVNEHAGFLHQLDLARGLENDHLAPTTASLMAAVTASTG
jgi:hypothetical protein